jgi:hypothetical protein
LFFLSKTPFLSFCAPNKGNKKYINILESLPGKGNQGDKEGGHQGAR